MADLRTKHRHACRYVLLIQTLEAQPLPYEHKDIRSYLDALQRQYEQLRLKVKPERVRQARKAVCRIITERTLSGAAQGLVPGLQQLKCQRNIAHPGLDDALRHLDELTQSTGDTGLGIYACPVFNGFHVGHGKKKKHAASFGPE